MSKILYSHYWQLLSLNRSLYPVLFLTVIPWSIYLQSLCLAEVFLQAFKAFSRWLKGETHWTLDIHFLLTVSVSALDIRSFLVPRLTLPFSLSLFGFLLIFTFHEWGDIATC